MDRSLLLNPPVGSASPRQIPPPVKPLEPPATGIKAVTPVAQLNGQSLAPSNQTTPSLAPSAFNNANTSTASLALSNSSSTNSSPPSVSPEGTPAPHSSRKTRTRSMASRSKPRQPSFNSSSSSLDSIKPLNTHSPIAVAAAAAVTAEKIKKLLATQGPLPIRHITSHLASTIPGFGELSLSKQRRLIIAVLDAPRSEFIKIGWGRWAVRGDTIIRKESLGGNAALNASAMRQVAQQSHRESISRKIPNAKIPLSPPLDAADGSAVFSDSDSEYDEDEDDSEIENTDEEDWQSIGPTKLRQTSPREQDAIFALVRLKSN